MKLTETTFNFAKEISCGALLTGVKENGDKNTMTVSWGGSGILWGKEVCFVFVRPERYTYEFCQDGEKMSLSFFGEERRSTLSFCGTKSGRDVNKFKECNLDFYEKDGHVVFKDAKATVLLKKLYAQDLNKEFFTSIAPLTFYQNGGYHKMYVCEVFDVIIQD